MQKEMKYLLYSILLLGMNVVSAQKIHSYAGHFIDRDGRTDLIIRDNGSTFEVDLTKDGGYNIGHAHQKDGILYGFFTTGKDSTAFNILMQETTLLLTSNGYHLALNKADDYEYEAPSSYDFPAPKVAMEIPYPSGNRVYSQSGKISFNLPDDSWDFTEQDGVFNLEKEGVKGYLRIVPHEIATINFARKYFNIKDLYPGKIDLVSAEMEYGKRGVFRTYAGFDAENRNIKFHIMTIVGLEGNGVHILSGSHSNYYKKDYELWCKMIANSLEFTK